MLRLPPNGLNKLVGPALVLLFPVVFLATALLFPATGAAGAALLVLVALLGVAVVEASARFKLVIPPWADVTIVAVTSIAASAALFAPLWNAAGLRVYDWAPHHANLRHLIDGLREGHVPRWVQSVSTGDSPYELYAFLPYYIAAKAAVWTNATDLTLVMVRSAIVIHSLTVLGAGLLARKLVAWPWAVLVALATLYDVGSVFGGGVDGLFLMGVAHAPLANAIWAFALIAIISALQRPRLWKTVAVWALVALAVSCHALALVSAVATMAALLLVALLARDLPPRRALTAILHVAIGVSLVAAVWMPFAQRLKLYGVHFAAAGKLPWASFGHMLGQPIPETSVPPLVYAGYLGILVAAFSRRTLPTLIAGFAAVVFVGLFDQVYTLLDLVPSVGMAHFQTVRLASAAKIPIYVCGVYLLVTALAAVRTRLADRGARLVGALLALALLGILRAGLPHFDRLGTQLRELASREVPDSDGLKALAGWAREQNAALGPERFGRLLQEEDRKTQSIMHVNALSGLPGLRVGVLSTYFLREQLENVTPASLRRFNVRWAVRLDRPPSFGDPATERRFGRYFLHELPDWDGKFARVERGAGTAVVTRLEDERVDVELRGTDQPALVALGMGYYPRWQAWHEQRGAVPVYGVPAIQGGQLQVVAAWLPPGRTTFTPSGRLPADGRGQLLTAVSLLIALAIVVIWSRLPRVRIKVLVGMANTSRWLAKHQRRLAWAAAGCFAIGLSIAAVRAALAPARALQLGNALRGGASVEVRDFEGRWLSCPYLPLYGAYRCPGPVLVQDTTGDLLNDAPPSWPFAVPAIHLASTATVDVRIRLKARLAGEYWAGSNGPATSVAISGEPTLELSGAQTSRSFAPSAEARSITMTATVVGNSNLLIAFVQRASLIPERGYLSAPATSPFR